MLCGSFKTQTNRKQYNILYPYICIIHFCQQQQKNAYKTHIVRISVKTVNKEKKISRKRQMNGRKSFVFLNHKKKKNGMRRIEFLHCMKKSLQIYEQIKAVYIHFASLYMYMIKYLKGS